jgi:two-component system response regulator PilR (NtrC family)
VRILAVDDERENLDLIQRVLGRKHDLRSFTDPEAARRVIGRGQFDILITDMVMPNVSGVELARAAREHEPRSVVVMVSAYTDTQEVLVAHSEGVIDLMLTKPWAVTAMRESIERASLLCDMRGL